MFFTVFSTNVSPYMQWQSELLEYTWKLVGQQGALIRLVATEDPSNLPLQRHAQCIATRLWDRHPETGDHYPIYNKPASLLEWLVRERPEGTVLLVDPDCVFRLAVDRDATPGFPVSQKWVDLPTGTATNDSPFGLGPRFRFLRDHCARVDLSAVPVMIPTLIHTSDLLRICPRWLELCGVVRENLRNDKGERVWESDMYAYLVACAEYGLVHEPVSLGICTNWLPEQAPDAPIIHYCQNIIGVTGEKIFGKFSYSPWERLDANARPRHDYGRDMIEIINRFVDRREGVRGAAEGAATDFPLPPKLPAASPEFRAHLLERRSAIASLLHDATGGRVTGGPFAGMLVRLEVSWDGGAMSSKLLGCYEAELHAPVLRAVERTPAKIINIGCAEGYCAIGLARLLPDADVHAFDTHDSARAICRRAAIDNGLDERRFRIHAECTPVSLARVLAGDIPSLVVSDCEGAEMTLLDPQRVPELANCDIIVKCHDLYVPGVTEKLMQRFSATHDIEMIRESQRDPGAFPVLAEMPSLDRVIAIHEDRPRIHWLAMWRKEGSDPKSVRVKDVDFGHGISRKVHYRQATSDEDVIRFISARQYDFGRLRRQPALSRFCEKRKKAGKRPLVIDAGANIGTSAIWFTFHVPGCQVISIEPDPENFEILGMNVAGLDVYPKLAAIGFERGIARLVDTGGDYHARQVRRDSGQEPGGVQIVTINDLYGEMDASCFPYIVKIDIEGGEEDLFSGNLEWVEKTPLIIIELHDWLLQGSANSKRFLECMANSKRDFVYFGEHIYSISNTLVE